MKVKNKYLSVASFNEYSSGQRQQFESEIKAASKIGEIDWDVKVFHNGEIRKPYEANYPLFFSLVFFRSLYCWMYMIRHSKKYTFVFNRHMTFDIFSWLTIFVKNRITIHHSKEIEELRIIRKGFKGTVASTIERIFGTFSIKHASAVAGVTREIAEYECKRAGNDKPILVFPNGIDVNNIKVLGDKRSSNNEIHMAFVCGVFSGWHGLDLLLNEMKSAPKYQGYDFNLHLIGKLSDEQIKDCQLVESKNLKIHIHGFLGQEVYRDILSHCDIGIGSLGMHRQNLAEGSTLKVREYLAMGLPVFASHKDVAFVQSYNYYHFGKIYLTDILSFCLKMKEVDRELVRSVSHKHINKEDIFVSFIKDVERTLL